MDTEQLFFGMNRESDEKALNSFLHLFSNERLTDVLIPRMSDEEIIQTVDFLTGIMRRHLKETEYHELFLGEKDPHHKMKQ